jgi:hypothetical protein
MLLDFFLWGYVKDIVTSLNELKLRTIDVIETVTLQMVEDTWWETEYCSHILHATKGTRVEVV